MRVRGHECHLIGTEGSSPPLPYIEVSANEGKALIGLGVAKAVTGEELDAEAEAETAAAEALAAEAQALEDAAREEAEAELAALNAAEEEAARLAAEAEANANEGEGEGDDSDGEEDPAAAERANTIAEALDLVEEAGLVKTGDRKGHPTVKAIEDITGLTDVTADEIDAAVAAKDSAV